MWTLTSLKLTNFKISWSNNGRKKREKKDSLNYIGLINRNDLIINTNISCERKKWQTREKKVTKVKVLLTLFNSHRHYYHQALPPLFLFHCFSSTFGRHVRDLKLPVSVYCGPNSCNFFLYVLWRKVGGYFLIFVFWPVFRVSEEHL